MLTQHHFATIRAALQYWADEMCPHGPEAMRPYLDLAQTFALDASRVYELRDSLGPNNIRYIRWDYDQQALAGTGLLSNVPVDLKNMETNHFATVILPADPKVDS